MDAYGGALSYGVRYRLGRGPPEPTSHPDVLLRGHGRQLRARAGDTQPDVLNRRHVPLTEVGVRRNGDGGGRGWVMMAIVAGDAGYSGGWVMPVEMGGL